MPQISDDAAFSALLRTNFAFFLQVSFKLLGGGRRYDHNWHIDAITHRLDQVRLGECTRLMVTMPPRHLKSIMISTVWVAWMLGHNPWMRFMCISYRESLSHKHASDCLRIISTDWYKRAFPELRLTRRTVEDFETSRGGGRFSPSISGAITGRGADCMILDDPMKADDALSEEKRERIIDWFTNVAQSRLEDQAVSSIILVMQRLNEADLVGEMQRLGGWDELRLSAIATQDELVPLPNGKFYQRREGCALFPARQSLETLIKRRDASPYVFATQYQQEPVPRVGAFVQREWFGTYDELRMAA